MPAAVANRLYPTPTPAPAVPDLRDHPNAVRLDNQADIEKMKGILIDLVKMTKYLTKKDVKGWRNAWQRAISVENPSRVELYRHYGDALINLHLEGCISQRRNKVLRKKFRLVDRKSRQENEDLTKLLRSPWFKEWIELALDSKYWGHSLIQFGDVVTEPYLRWTDVRLVDREHVVPEYHVVKRYAADHYTAGKDYTVPPLSNWCMGIGKADNLGLLLKLVPQTISIRHMEGFWDQFGEIFGMPIRIAKSSARGSRERGQIEEMLGKMGAAAWGLFPDGTDIEIKETTRGDAFNVYDKRIERAEKSISKGVLGQTMTIDDGSSRSQGEVHLEVRNDIIESDADFITDLVNEMLIPFCNMHGFPFGDAEFEFVDVAQYTPQEQVNIETMLLQNFDIDPKYFQDKYNVPIQQRREQKPGLPPVQNFFE